MAITKKVLLILSPTQESKKSVERALDLAEEEKSTLIILFVLDEELSENVIKKFSEESWMAHTVSEQLNRAILKEYSFSGKLKIKATMEAALKRNIHCETITRRGKLLEEALKVIAEEKIDQVVITTKYRSSLSKFLFGSILDDLKKKFDGEIIDVIDPT